MADDINARNQELKKRNQETQRKVDAAAAEYNRLADEAERNPTPDNLARVDAADRNVSRIQRQASDENRAIYDNANNTQGQALSADQQAQVNRLAQQSRDVYTQNKTFAQVANENNAAATQSVSQTTNDFMAQNNISVTPGNQRGQGTYTVTTESVTGGGSRTVTIPQQSADFRAQYAQAESQEEANRAEALAAYKAANPQLTSMQAAARFNTEVRNGTVTYDKPTEALEAQRQSQPPITTVSPGVQSTTITETQTEQTTATSGLPQDAGGNPPEFSGAAKSASQTVSGEEVDNDVDDPQDVDWNDDGDDPDALDADIERSNIQSDIDNENDFLSADEQANLDTYGDPLEEQQPVSPSAIQSEAVEDAKRGLFAVPNADDLARKAESAVDAARVFVGTQNIGTQGVFFPVRYNPLHDLTSYTYTISMHVLTATEYNDLMINPTGWVPQQTIIGGAGRRDFGGVRNEFFYEDFYIDNLSFQTTMAGKGEAIGTSNILELKFTIHEPYGLTFINRLMEIAASDVQLATISGNANQVPWSEMAYLIQIHFYGYDAEGAPADLSNLTKNIPVNITDIQIRTGSKGSEYQCTAVPFVHKAYDPDILSTPVGLEAQAKTLSELFSVEGQAEIEAKFKADLERDESKRKTDALTAAKAADNKSRDSGTTTPPPVEGKTDEKKTEDEAAQKRMYKIRSYTSAYNAWQASLVKNNHSKSYNEIRVVFADEILEKEKIVQPEVQSVKKTPSTDRGTKEDPQAAQQTARARAGAADAGPKTDMGKFPIAAGDFVTAIIDRAMQNSDYWRSQFADTSKDAIEDQIQKKDVIKAWKIQPRVEYKEYDELAGRWTYITTFYVVVNIRYNRAYRNAPRQFPTGWHRRYDYIYTGKNVDILDWQLSFNHGDVVNLVIDRGKGQTTAGAQASPDQEKKLEQDPEKVKELSEGSANDPDNPAAENKTKPGSGFNPVRYRYISEDAKASSTGDMRKDSKSQIASSMFNHLFMEAASMSEIKLKIVGDPCFIKQDEIFYPPDTRITSQQLHAGQGAFIDDGGTIRMEGAPVHARLTFKSPVDVDPESGLMRLDGKFQTMVWSGLYDLITCTNTFNQGKFEQDLVLNRLPDQDEDLAAAEAENGQAEREITVASPPFSSVPATVKTAGAGFPRATLDEFNLPPATNLPDPGDFDDGAELRGVVNDEFEVDVEDFDDEFGAVIEVDEDDPITFPDADDIDPDDYPSGVTRDDITGLPTYDDRLFEGTQKDLEAWKEAIDANFPYKYVKRNPDNGNDEIVSI
jgi:hypothetical protein